MYQAQADSMKLPTEFSNDIKHIRDEHRFGEIREDKMTLNAYAKTGMNTLEFSKYLNSAILSLYLDVANQVKLYFYYF